MTFCIPFSEYLANAELYDLASEPGPDCSGCGVEVFTPAGINSQIELSSQEGSEVGVSIIFDSVLSSGITTFTVLKDSSSPEENILEFYIKTSCVFSGNILLVFKLPNEGTEDFFDNITILRDGQDSTVRSGIYAPDFLNKQAYAISDGFTQRPSLEYTSPIRVQATLSESFWRLISGRCSQIGGTFCQKSTAKFYKDYKCMKCVDNNDNPVSAYDATECRCYEWIACCERQVDGDVKCRDMMVKDGNICGGKIIRADPGENKISCNSNPCCSLKKDTDCPAANNFKINSVLDKSCMCECIDPSFIQCPPRSEGDVGSCKNPNDCATSEGAALTNFKFDIDSCTCICQNECTSPKKVPLPGSLAWPNCDLDTCKCDRELAGCGTNQIVVPDGEGCKCICDESTGFEEFTIYKGDPILERTGCYEKCKFGKVRNERGVCECSDEVGDAIGSFEPLRFGRYPCGMEPNIEDRPCYRMCLGNTSDLSPNNTGSCDCVCSRECPPDKKLRQKISTPPGSQDDCDCICDEYKPTFLNCKCTEENDGRSCPDGQKYNDNCKCICEDEDKVPCGDSCKEECSKNMIFDSKCDCVCDTLTGFVMECNNECYQPCSQSTQLRLPPDCKCSCPTATFNGSGVNGSIVDGECKYNVTCFKCDECPTGRTRSLSFEQINSKSCSSFGDYVNSCPETCTNGKKINDECKCECPEDKDWCPSKNECVSKVCTAPKTTYNSSKCECECPPDACVGTGGKVQDEESCECECPLNTKWCEAKGLCVSSVCIGAKTYAESSCKCECPPFTDDCIGNEILTDECKCECPPDTEWCPSKNECVSKMCADAKKLFISSSCKCECPPDICTGGKVQDEESCECECPLNTDWCVAKGLCVSKMCTAPKTTYNSSKCECECNLFDYDPCPGGKSFDDDCKCECPPETCTGGKVQNEESCKCECPSEVNRDCIQEQKFNEDSCECECPSSDPSIFHCEGLKVFDIYSCKCECLPDTECGEICCPSGYKCEGGACLTEMYYCSS